MQATLHVRLEGAAAGGSSMWQHLPTGADQRVSTRVRTLWTGVGATLARDVPFSAIYWQILEPLRTALLPPDRSTASQSQVRWMTLPLMRGSYKTLHIYDASERVSGRVGLLLIKILKCWRDFCFWSETQTWSECFLGLKFPSVYLLLKIRRASARTKLHYNVVFAYRTARNASVARNLCARLDQPVGSGELDGWHMLLPAHHPTSSCQAWVWCLRPKTRS